MVLPPSQVPKLPGFAPSAAPVTAAVGRGFFFFLFQYMYWLPLDPVTPPRCMCAHCLEPLEMCDAMDYKDVEAAVLRSVCVPRGL